MTTVSPVTRFHANYEKLCLALQGRERISTFEAARLLDCHVTTVRRLIWSGNVKATSRRAGKVGQRLMVHVDSLKAFAKARFEEKDQRARDSLIAAEQKARVAGDIETVELLRKGIEAMWPETEGAAIAAQ